MGHLALLSCTALLGALLLAVLPGQAESVANDQHAAAGITTAKADEQFPHRTTHPGAQWYPHAGFGLFIHWGLSSVEANHELSWAMLANVEWNPNPLTPEQYFGLAKEFNPQQYDADKWIKAAKDAGFTYAVMTTKHHDGYALWPCKFGDFNTSTYLGGRDLIKPFVDACRKYGLRVGFYYSPPDWYYNRQYMSFGHGSDGSKEKPHLGLKHEPVTLPQKPAEFNEQYRAYETGQIEELLTRYGKIDLFWFDGGFPGPQATLIARMRELQPGIVINDRSGIPADFNTSFEGRLPEERQQGWWEVCESGCGSWGYTRGEYYKSTAEILNHLVRIRAWDGNYLLNFGPMADGRMPEKFYQRMREVTAWMQHSGESVRGAVGGPYPAQTTVPVTTKGTTWYLHALPEYKETTITVTGVQRPASVTLLRTNTRLHFTFANARLLIDLPADQRTELPDVIAVKW